MRGNNREALTRSETRDGRELNLQRHWQRSGYVNRCSLKWEKRAASRSRRRDNKKGVRNGDW